MYRPIAELTNEQIGIELIEIEKRKLELLAEFRVRQLQRIQRGEVVVEVCKPQQRSKRNVNLDRVFRELGF